MSRHMWACVAIVAMLAYQIETQVALACTSSCGNGHNANCKCPDDGNCHPDGSSLSIHHVFQHATECRVHSDPNTATRNLWAQFIPIHSTVTYLREIII